MEDSSQAYFIASLLFAVIGIAAVIYLHKKRADLIRSAKAHGESIKNRAQRDGDKIVQEANDECSKLVQDAKDQLSNIEARIERLKVADVDLQARLKEVRGRLETMTDIAGEQAGSIEIISEDDLLTTQEYQDDRKKVRALLRSAAQDAVKNLRGHRSDVNIGKYVGISAKSDLSGALLLITTEMLCAKTTANNGHASIEKLHDSVRATGALLKAVHSEAELDEDFLELLEKRLRVEINYKRAKQVARDRQRELREQEREETKARKEAEKAQVQAERDEEIKKQAIAELEQKMLAESDEARVVHEAELDALRQELVEAQERAERARSRAQDTKQGHVYIISNIGSFGKDVLKIGMTRRLNPIDRVRELGDASVPFTFDIHALIECDDAPSLENELHRMFDERRVNKINRRKEYFRVSVKEIEEKLSSEGVNALVIPVASADEYYESIKLENRS